MSSAKNFNRVYNQDYSMGFKCDLKSVTQNIKSYKPVITNFAPIKTITGNLLTELK